MGRAARKGTNGAGVRGNSRINLLENKYQAEGTLQESEWVDLHSLRHGVDLEELPEFFQQTLYELPASQREDLLGSLSEKDLGEIQSSEEALSLIRSQNSDEPQLHTENALGLQVSLDEKQRPHSIVGPAVIWPNGTEGYYEHGKEVRDGRPCRIYPDGSREYLDSYDDDMEMNIYRKVSDDKIEWVLETGHPIRRIRGEDDQIFPAGTGDLLTEDPYTWAGEKFHGNPDAYKEERQEKTDLQEEAGEYSHSEDNKSRERIRMLVEKRHSFFIKEDTSDYQKESPPPASPEELEIWEEEFLEGREPGTPESEISPDAQRELDRILEELSD